MTVNLDTLRAKSRDELVALAKELNVPHHRKNSVDTLAESIINHVMNPPQTSMPAAEVKREKPLVFCTEDEVEAALAGVKKAKPALTTSYDNEARAVRLSYNDGRHRYDETVNLSAGIDLIKRRAMIVAKGQFVLRGHKPDDFGGAIAPSTGINAYTNTVLG